MLAYAAGAEPESPSVLLPQLAGSAYPADPDDLADAIARAIVAAQARPLGNPKLVIAPNGPLAQAGPVIASALAGLAIRSEIIRRVVIIGSAHKVILRGLAAPLAEALRTPLGDVSIDRFMIKRLKPFAEVSLDDRPFAGEATIEMLLPFLQVCLDRFEVVPILIGNAEPKLIEAVLEAVWGGPETLIIVSSNLSSEARDDKVRAIDAETRAVVETLAAERMSTQRAPGHRAIAAALLRARALDLRATGVDFGVASETIHGMSRSTGFGAFVFESAMQSHLPREDRQQVLSLAARMLHAAVQAGTTDVAPIPLGRLPMTLSAQRAVFITLEKDRAPRGQAGTLNPMRGLATEVLAQTVRAAVGDPRFPQVRPEELDALTLTVSILSHPRPIPAAADRDALQKLIPGRTGLVVEDRARTIVQLPMAWEQFADPVMFLAAARQRANFDLTPWPASLKMRGFSAESFSAPVGSLLKG